MSRILNTIERKLDAILKKCKCNNVSPIPAPSGFVAFLSTASPDIESDACITSPAGGTYDTTYYHDGTGTNINGANVYTNEVGTLPMPDGLYSYEGEFWFLVTSGVASTEFICK